MGCKRQEVGNEAGLEPQATGVPVSVIPPHRLPLTELPLQPQTAEIKARINMSRNMSGHYTFLLDQEG